MQGNGALCSEEEQHGIDGAIGGSYDCGIINLHEQEDVPNPEIGSLGIIDNSRRKSNLEANNINDELPY